MPSFHSLRLELRQSLLPGMRRPGTQMRRDVRFSVPDRGCAIPAWPAFPAVLRSDVWQPFDRRAWWAGLRMNISLLRRCVDAPMRSDTHAASLRCRYLTWTTKRTCRRASTAVILGPRAGSGVEPDSRCRARSTANVSWQETGPQLRMSAWRWSAIPKPTRTGITVKAIAVWRRPKPYSTAVRVFRPTRPRQRTAARTTLQARAASVAQSAGSR